MIKDNDKLKKVKRQYDIDFEVNNKKEVEDIVNKMVANFEKDIIEYGATSHKEKVPYDLWKLIQKEIFKRGFLVTDESYNIKFSEFKEGNTRSYAYIEMCLNYLY